MSGNLFKHSRSHDDSTQGLNHERPPTQRRQSSPDAVTPEQNQNAIEKQIHVLTRAPQKTSRPPILKTKVSQQEMNGAAKEDKSFVVVATKSKGMMRQTDASVNGVGCQDQRPSNNSKQNLNSQHNSKLLNGFTNKTSNTSCKSTEVKTAPPIKHSIPTPVTSGSQPKKDSRKSLEISSRSRSTSRKVDCNSTMESAHKPHPTKDVVQGNSSTILLYPAKSRGDRPSATSINEHEAEEMKQNGLSQNDEGDTSIHDCISQNPVVEGKTKKKPTYFKSKFWDYVVPNKKYTAPNKQEKGKKYDPVQVRDFMEKQKELRRLREKQEEEEKRRITEKKKLQLQELDEKRKDLLKPSTIKKESSPVIMSNIPKLRFSPKSRETILPSTLKPMKVTRSSLGNTDSALRTSLLLHEFENIVHNECLNVLRLNSDKMVKFGTEKMDKSVETTNSLYESSPNARSMPLRSVPQVGNFRNSSSIHLRRNIAAVKIQSVFRGYMTRKFMREENLLPRVANRPRRRDSFYSASRKPMDPNLYGLSSLTRQSNNNFSPVLRDRIGADYVQPLQNIPAHVSKSFEVTPSPQFKLKPFITPRNSRSRFEEPFPIQAIQNLQLTCTPPVRGFSDRRLSLESRVSPLLTRVEPIPPHSSETMDKNRRFSLGQHLPQTKLFDMVESRSPSFSTVLREKLRILQKTTQPSAAMKRDTRTALETVAANLEKKTRQIKSTAIFQYDSETCSNLSQMSNDKSTTEATITDDYIGPDPDEMKRAYLRRKSKRFSHDPVIPILAPRNALVNGTIPTAKTKQDQQRTIPDNVQRRQSLKTSDSSTTVETDAELKRRDEILKRKHQLPSEDSTAEDESDASLKRYPVHILEMAFKAEQDRMNILDQALQATMASEVWKARKTNQQLGSEVHSNKLGNTNTSNNNNSEVLVQLAKCQAEHLKTTTEITKWVSDLRKSSVEKDAFQQQQQPINMAAMVTAAVEEAKRFTQEREMFLYQQSQQRILIKDQVSQFPSESSTSETPKATNKLKMKASERGTQVFESHLRRLHEEQNQRLSSTRSKSEIVQSDASCSVSSIRIDADSNYSTDFEKESPSISNEAEVKQIGNAESSLNQISPEEPSVAPIVSVSKEEQSKILTDEDDFQANSNKSKHLSLPETSMESDIGNSLPEEFTDSQIKTEEQHDVDSSYKLDFEKEPPSSISEHNKEQETSSSQIGIPVERIIVSTSKEEQFNILTDKEENVVQAESKKSLVIPETSLESDIENSIPEEFSDSQIKTEDHHAAANVDSSYKVDSEKEPLSISDHNKEQGTGSQFSEIRIPLEQNNAPTSKEEQSKILTNEEEDDFQVESNKSEHSSFPETSLESDIGISIQEEFSQMKTEEHHVAVNVDSSSKIDLEEESPPISNHNEVLVLSSSLPEIPENSNHTPNDVSKEEVQVSLKEIDDVDTETKESEILSIPVIPVDKYDISLEVKDVVIEDSLPEKIPDEVGIIEPEEHPETEENSAAEINEAISYESDFESESFSASKHDGNSLSSSLSPPVVLDRGEVSNETDVDVPLTKTLVAEILSNDRSLHAVTEKIVIRMLNETMNEEKKTEAIEIQGVEQPIQSRIKEILDGIKHDNYKADTLGKPSPFNSPMFVDDYEKEADQYPGGDDEEWFEDEFISPASLHPEDETLREEAAKIYKEQKRVENEIRALESLAAREIPDKPPPPYSPPSSSGSSSLSLYARFFAASFDEVKLKNVINEQVEVAWTSWSENGNLEDFVNYSAPSTTPGYSSGAIPESFQRIAARSFEELTVDTVRQIIVEVLQTELEADKPLVEKIRRGPLSLFAHQSRIPCSKDKLGEVVYGKFMEVFPPELVAECMSSTTYMTMSMSNRKPWKWTSRPRDLVDEVLVDEMVEEDREWTEHWPEEILVKNKIQENILKRAIQEVLLSFQVSLST